MFLSLALSVSVFADQKFVDTGHSPRLEALYIQVLNVLRKAREGESEEQYRKALDLLETDLDSHSGLLLQRAYLQQRFHQFDEALKTLYPIEGSAQASLLRASVYLTKGQAQQARRACSKLVGKTDPLISTVCMTKAASINGELSSSYDALKKIADSRIEKQGGGLHWAYVTLAEMAERLDRTSESKHYYKKALVIKPNDVVSRMEYADILLAEQSYDKVVELVEDYSDHDPLFLRFVRASRALSDPKARAYYCYLKGEVNTMKRENNHLHLDVLAEYDLYLEDKPTKALEWAKMHWAQQKTPRDARLLARAAIRAGDLDTLEQLDDWRSVSRLEDAQLDELLGARWLGNS